MIVLAVERLIVLVGYTSKWQALKADPNAITPQQARTAFTRYGKKIDVTKEELAWNFGCISASQSNEQEAVLVRELILSNNKRLYLGAQSAADS